MKYAPTSLISTLFYGLLSIGAEGCSSLSAEKPGAMALQALGRSDESSRSGMRVLDSLSFISGGTAYDLVILKNIAEDTIDIPRSWEGVRPLLLYRYASESERKLILRNDSLVMCQGCGGIFGDPYSGIEFVRDTLKLYHYGGSNWRWAETHGFVHGSNGDWPLVLRTSVSYSVFEPDSTSETTNHVPLATERLATCVSAW